MTYRFNSILLISSIVILTMILSSSCKDDEIINPCNIPTEGVNYTLSDTALEYVSNYADVNKVFFNTNTGAEVVFEIVEKNLTTHQNGTQVRCKMDSSQLQQANGTSEFMKITMFNANEIGQLITISLFEFPIFRDSVVFEGLSVDFDKFNLFSQHFLAYKVNGYNEFSIVHDSLDLGGKVFYSVIETNFPNETAQLDILYTKAEGIIFMKDNATGKEYYYNRVE